MAVLRLYHFLVKAGFCSVLFLHTCLQMPKVGQRKVGAKWRWPPPPRRPGEGRPISRGPRPPRPPPPQPSASPWMLSMCTLR